MAIARIMGGMGLLVILAASVVCGQGTGELARLQAAGIGDETLALIVKEKILPTQALTVDELIQLKQGGMADDTMQMLIREASFFGTRTNRVYGDLTHTIKSLTVSDLIRLKEAGLSDEVIRSVVVYRAADSSAADKAHAWEMLKNMDIKLLLK